MSILHQLDPRVKLVVTFLFILSSALLPDGAWLAFGFSWILVLICSHLANLGWGYSLKRSFVALPFALAAFTVIFTIPGQTVTTLEIGPWQLYASDAGLLRFSSILVRSWLSVQMAILLTATTQFPDLAHALRHLKMSPILIAIISFMYRYLFVLSEEVLRLLRARTARSARLPGEKVPPMLWQARVAGNLVGQLFLRSYERSDRIYDAMLARGYKGRFLTINPHSMQAKDWVAGGLGILFITCIQIIAQTGNL